MTAAGSDGQREREAVKARQPGMCCENPVGPRPLASAVCRRAPTWEVRGPLAVTAGSCDLHIAAVARHLSLGNSTAKFVLNPKKA